jgi:hypothetical protein
MTTTEQSVIAPVDVADGIHPGIPDPDYRKWPRMNASTLEWGMETMEHLKAAWDGELNPKSKALAFGIAGHCKLLEPTRFKEQYAIKGQCEGKTKAGKQCENWGAVRVCGHWYCGTHEPEATPDVVETLTDTESETLDRMAGKVFAHPAVALLRQNGGCEVSIAWTDRTTGLKLKGRLDKWIPECRLPGDTQAWPAILDLKTVRSCDPRLLAMEIEEFGWHRRAAMYRDGIETLTGHVPDYLLVCILKTPPYSVVVKQLGEESLRGGRDEYRDLLKTWKNCLKTGKYPGYGDDIDTADVPEWKLKEYRAMEKLKGAEDE